MQLKMQPNGHDGGWERLLLADGLRRTSVPPSLAGEGGVARLPHVRSNTSIFNIGMESNIPKAPPADHHHSRAATAPEQRIRFTDHDQY